MNRRIITVFAAAILVLSAGPAISESLLVTSEGDSIWVKDISTEGQWLYCKVAKTSEKRSFSTTEIDGVVNRVKRGRKYSTAEIEKSLNRVSKLLRRHPRLGKQLRMLKQEWQALKKGDSTDLSSSIEEYVEEFEIGSKDPKAYQNVAVKLDMLRFKDVAGRYADQIQGALDEMKKDFVEINSKRLSKMSRSGPKSIDNYAECSELIAGMTLARLDTDTMDRLEDQLASYRRVILKRNLERARSVFMRNKEVESYLESSAIFDDLIKKVAQSDAEKRGIRKERQTLRRAATKALDDYNFGFEGFALHVSDSEMIRRGWVSKVNLHVYQLDEHCMMFPRKRMRKAKLGVPFGIPYRIVFNREVPADRDYYLIGMYYLPGRPSHRVVRRLKDFEIEAGRADVGFGMKLPELPDDYDVPDGDAKPSLCVFVAYKETSVEDDDHADWKAASLGCFIPLDL